MSAALCAVAALRRVPPPRPLPSLLLRASSAGFASRGSTASYNESSYSHGTASHQSPSQSSASSASPRSPSPTSSSGYAEPALLSRSGFSPLSESESHRSVLDLYRKLCRLLPQVLRGYELEGEDSYHRAIRNLRFHFEHHRQLTDRHVVEVLRHKAEMEIEEALLMYKTKSHVAALIFQEPQLASVARHARQLRQRDAQHGGQQVGAQSGGAAPSPFLQDFLAGTA